MAQLVVVLIGALVVAAIGFGVAALISAADPGLAPTEPDGRAVPLPAGRPLTEADVAGVRFDTAIRGYRMGQVDAAMRRAAYDLGYKQELVGVLEAELAALRDGRVEEAEGLRHARQGAKASGLAAEAADAVSVEAEAEAESEPGVSPGTSETEGAPDVTMGDRGSRPRQETKLG